MSDFRRASAIAAMVLGPPSPGFESLEPEVRDRLNGGIVDVDTLRTVGVGDEARSDSCGEPEGRGEGDMVGRTRIAYASIGMAGRVSRKGVVSPCEVEGEGRLRVGEFGFQPVSGLRTWRWSGAVGYGDRGCI